uniref:VQ domain-containing protein n=1 Tax=Rhizophora mucronata TaxID=61149 RepID=A0A2P2NH05_RHIMU
MEDTIKKQPCLPTSTASPIAMHRDSQTISKVKPKIRITHIFAPEIIKTDVASFRELVQRLTGKPPERSCKKRPRIARARTEDIQSRGTSNYSARHDHKPLMTKTMELRSGFVSLGSRDHQRVKKEEEEMWNETSSGGFLGVFSDLDGLMQDLGEFPLMPEDPDQMQWA